MDFTKKVLQHDRVRLIGVCFGHQIIGRALDVKVDRSDRGWEVSVTKVQLTEQGKKLFGIDELVSVKRIAMRSWVEQQQQEALYADNCGRLYIKCIAISCMSIPQARSRWGIHLVARCRECISKVA